MKLVRAVLLALLFSLLAGFAIGTVLRLRMEQPVVYLGRLAPGEAPRVLLER